jgi:hypothetical protein
MSVKLSEEMVGESLLYNDSVIGFVYETKARPLQPDLHRAARPPAPLILCLQKSNILRLRNISFTFAEIVPFPLLAFIKGKDVGL